MNAHCECYLIARIYGREVLFSRQNIDRATLPVGMRMYVIKPDDNGVPAELAHSFIGEKYGAIITNRYIPLTGGWRRIRKRDLVIGKERFCSLREFMRNNPPKKKTRQLFGV